MQKKRPLSLTACILGLIFAALGIVLILIDIRRYGSWAFSSYELIIITVLEVAFYITIIVLSARLVRKTSTPDEIFATKQRKLAIALFVFDCIVVVASLYLVVIGSSSLFTFFSFAAFALCGVFFMIDVCRNAKAVAPAKPAGKSAKSLVNSLNELKTMKDSGLISEEDYEKLKANVIQNYKG